MKQVSGGVIIVLSFGKTPETVFEDATPFPYDLADEQLINEENIHSE